MTREDLLTCHDAMCLAAKDLMEKKNSDYAHGSDPFANFTMFGEDEALRGMVFRMGDKLRRLYKASTGAGLENETVEDTCLDLINYAVVFAAYHGK